MEKSRCSDCGAVWRDGVRCVDHFHTLGFWELDHNLPDVHHLMVLCYYLQHPSLYSVEGLAGAKKLLVSFLEMGITPATMRQRMTREVASDRRTYKIRATPESVGAYAQPVIWPMRVEDVVMGGMADYYESVQRWAESSLTALRESGNLG